MDLPEDAQIVVCVGNLVDEKRPDLALAAAASIEGVFIVFVGRGPERVRLERMAGELSIGDRVRFLAETSQVELRSVYSAADALVLASKREGWPNVLLEAAACGTPIVAFPVGGVPEILGDPGLGVMTSGNEDAQSLSRALRMLLKDPPPRDVVRAAAMRFAWQPVLEAQVALYRRAAGIQPSTQPSLEAVPR